MNTKRKICIVSSSRADYNHLFLLMKNLKQSKDVNFKLIVTGMHLLKEYGGTYQEIIQDGFKIDAYIKSSFTKNFDNIPLDIMSTQLKNAGVVLDKIKPDIIIILGDRYDIFPIAIACHLKGIPLAHFHGGEITHGAIDDAIRHSITKLSDIHFVGNADFKKRVKQLGENPKLIFNIGSLGVLAINSTKKIVKSEILKKFNIKNNYIMISLHPETINDDNDLIIKSLFKVLSECVDTHIVFTCPNSDSGNEKIIYNIQRFLKLHPKTSTFIKSAGREAYINLVRYTKLLVGNSSSCVIEAPALNTKSLLIGKRQHGRPLASSVTKTDISYSSIKTKMNKILKDKIQNKSTKNKLSYKGKDSISRIIRVLTSISLDNIKLKKFKDQNE